MVADRNFGRTFLTALKALNGKAWMLLFCLLLAFNSSRSEGIDAVNNLNFDFYSHEHGLSSNQIHSILQDKKGWMRFGTSQGACRFDGYKFTVFKNDAEDSTSLKGNLVSAIFEDRKGQLWIGIENGGLNRFNREKENFQHLFSFGAHTELKDASVTSIHEDKAGNLWVGTETHLYLIKGENSITAIKPSDRPVFSDFFCILRSD